MYKTTISTPKVPTAYIAVNKSRIKVYTKSGKTPTCYLQKGQEFQIELFNPTTNVVLAKIELNGRLISQSGLILNPGQRIFLDRYIDVAQKFLFDTYEVSNSEEVKEAIQDNGDIRVYFYDEEIKLPVLTNGHINPFNLPTTSPYWYYGSSQTISSPSPLGLSGSLTTTELNGPDTIISSNNYINTVSYDSCNFVSSSLSDTTSLGGFSSNEVKNEPSPLRSKSLSRKSKTIETGRVEKGSSSNQSFTYVNKDFYSWPSHTVEYKLLPVSQKAITVDELMVKRYCTNCGGKVGKTDKYCSQCGTKI